MNPVAIRQISFEYVGRVYTCELAAPPDKIQHYSDHFERFCGSLRPNVWGYEESCDATRSADPYPRDAGIGRIGSFVLLQFGATCPRSRH